ncbi:MAG: NmrA family NAD(P)-binding protein [Bacteroidota bacterium]
MKEYLILGGTGMIGSHLVQQLTTNGHSTHVVTRSQEKADNLPESATGIVGDLHNPADYDKIFADAKNIFLVNTVSLAELQEGLAAINEAKRVGAEKVVYISVHHAEAGPNIPHFASKIAVERALKASDIPYTILRPNSFYQNDLWLKDAILQYRVYPQPMGNRGLSRIDVRDIAQAAVTALTQAGYENKTYSLVGPEELTGKQCAQIFSEELGEEVHYGGDDLKAWGEQASQMMLGWMVYDFSLMYELFQRVGLKATDDHLKETREILGQEPRAYRDFVKEAVASWK